MAVAVAVAAALGVTLAGCGSSVEVAPAPAAADPPCVAAAALWPATVSGMERRAVTGGATAVAAWGDPPVVVRCGVAPLGPTSTGCIDVDGVGWVPEALSDGTRFTSFGTVPAIEALVPAAYAPEPLLLPAFGPAARALPRNGLECR